MKLQPRNIALDLILTILLCGVWNLVVQNAQIQALNHLLKEERFSFWKIYFFSLLTCGAYFVYFQYQKAKAIGEITGIKEDADPILAVLLTLVGFHFVFDAILQSKLNNKIEKSDSLF